MDINQPLDDGFVNTSPSIDEQNHIQSLKREFFSNQTPVNRGRGALAFLILLEIISLLVSIQSLSGLELTIEALIILPYVAFLIFSGNYPHRMLLAGLVLYLVLTFLLAIFDPLSLFKGILIKVVICYLLFQGIQHAKRNREIKTELERFGEVPTNTYRRR